MRCNGCDDGLCRLGQSLSNKGYISNFEQDKSIVIVKCTDVYGPTKLLRVESKREDSRGILSTNVGVKTAKKDSLQLVRRDRACTGIRNSVHHVLKLDDGKLTQATFIHICNDILRYRLEGAWEETEQQQDRCQSERIAHPYSWGGGGYF